MNDEIQSYAFLEFIKSILFVYVILHIYGIYVISSIYVIRVTMIGLWFKGKV